MQGLGGAPVEIARRDGDREQAERDGDAARAEAIQHEGHDDRRQTEYRLSPQVEGKRHGEGDDDKRRQAHHPERRPLQQLHHLARANERKTSPRSILTRQPDGKALRLTRFAA